MLKAKDLAGALAAYTEAIELDGSDAAFRSNRSAVYMSMKEYEKALVDAEVDTLIRREIHPAGPFVLCVLLGIIN